LRAGEPYSLLFATVRDAVRSLGEAARLAQIRLRHADPDLAATRA
jgi:hypothetical protein